MKITELSERFFNEYKSSLFFGELFRCEAFCTAALVGEGSECFGFDDEISLDHDVDCGFCLILDDSAFAEYGMALQKAYNALPKEYLGIKRAAATSLGANRRGVFGVSGFYKSLIGVGGVPESLDVWRAIPEYALATAVNGKIFFDSSKEFEKVRSELLKGYPRDVKLKKLSSRLISAAQYGQYNFSRSVKRGDFATASLCVNGFVTSVVSAVYLLNNSYMPYYKWCLKGMESLNTLSDLKCVLEYLLCEETSKATAALKSEIIEDTAAAIIKELKNQHLTEGNWSYLEPHAQEVQKRIENRALRTEHIMSE